MENILIFLIGLSIFNIVIIKFLYMFNGEYMNKSVIQIMALIVFLSTCYGLDKINDISKTSNINPLWFLIILSILLLVYLVKLLKTMNEKGDDSAVIFIVIKFIFYFLLGSLAINSF
jgi:hypothetical protein